MLADGLDAWIKAQSAGDMSRTAERMRPGNWYLSVYHLLWVNRFTPPAIGVLVVFDVRVTQSLNHGYVCRSFSVLDENAVGYTYPIFSRYPPNLSLMTAISAGE